MIHRDFRWALRFVLVGLAVAGCSSRPADGAGGSASESDTDAGLGRGESQGDERNASEPTMPYNLDAPDVELAQIKGTEARARVTAELLMLAHLREHTYALESTMHGSARYVRVIGNRADAIPRNQTFGKLGLQVPAACLQDGPACERELAVVLTRLMRTAKASEVALDALSPGATPSESLERLARSAQGDDLAREVAAFVAATRASTADASATEPNEDNLAATLYPCSEAARTNGRVIDPGCPLRCAGDRAPRQDLAARVLTSCTPGDFGLGTTRQLQIAAATLDGLVRTSHALYRRQLRQTLSSRSSRFLSTWEYLLTSHEQSQRDDVAPVATKQARFDASSLAILSQEPRRGSTPDEALYAFVTAAGTRVGATPVETIDASGRVRELGTLLPGLDGGATAETLQDALTRARRDAARALGSGSPRPAGAREEWIVLGDARIKFDRIAALVRALGDGRPPGPDVVLAARCGTETCRGPHVATRPTLDNVTVSIERSGLRRDGRLIPDRDVAATFAQETSNSVRASVGSNVDVQRIMNVVAMLAPKQVTLIVERPRDPPRREAEETTDAPRRGATTSDAPRRDAPASPDTPRRSAPRRETLAH